VKKRIDIEKLLHWAIRDELPKGRPVSADIGLAIGRRLRQRAFSIARNLDHRPEIDSLGFVPGAPHEDAETVSDAVARLPTLVPIASEHDARHLFGDWAAIAEPIIPSLMVSMFNSQSIVTSCAAMGTRPKWQFAHPAPYQMFAQAHGAGRPRAIVYGIDADGNRVELKRNEGRARKRDGEYTLAMSPRSPLDWQRPEPLHIGECRAEYVAWHAALVSLAVALAGQLVEFEPVAPGAAAMPWITGEAPASRIVARRDLGEIDAGLPLAPRRRAAGKPIESPIEAETRAAYNLASRTKKRKTIAASA